MQGTTKSVVLDVGGTEFKTTRDTLSLSPFLNALISQKQDFDDDGESAPAIFLDEDPKIFACILNVLRDPTSPVPAKYSHRLAYYGIKDRALVRAPRFLPCFEETQWPINVREVDNVVSPVAQDATMFGLLTMCIKRAQNRLLDLPGAGTYTDVHGHCHNTISLDSVDFVSEICVDVGMRCDMLNVLRIHQQFTLPNGPHRATFGFGDIYKSFTLMMDGLSVLDFSGKTLDILWPFMRLKCLCLRTTDEMSVYDISFQLPMSHVSELPKSGHKHFMPGLRKAKRSGYPTYPHREGARQLVIKMCDGVKPKGGHVLEEGLLLDLDARERLYRHTQSTPMWFTQEHEWVFSQNLERLRFTNLITEMYFQVKSVNGASSASGETVPISSVEIILGWYNINDERRTIFGGETLQTRGGVYKVWFDLSVLNASATDYMRVGIIPKYLPSPGESFRCTVVAAGLNELVVGNGVSCLRWGL